MGLEESNTKQTLTHSGKKMQGGKVMFLEINNLKKSFGTGESRVEVLKGIQFLWKKVKSVFSSVRPVPVNRHC